MKLLHSFFSEGQISKVKSQGQIPRSNSWKNNIYQIRGIPKLQAPTNTIYPLQAALQFIFPIIPLKNEFIFNHPNNFKFLEFYILDQTKPPQPYCYTILLVKNILHFVLLIFL